MTHLELIVGNRTAREAAVKPRFRELVICALVLMLLTVPLSPALSVLAADPVVLDGTQSSWAKPELELAYSYGLTYPTVMNNFTKSITREEFCVIVVKLYEKLTGKTALAGTSPFTDTTNPEIIKAYGLGVVQGTGAGKFSPALSITRQEIATMIYRALGKAVYPLTAVSKANFPFADKAKVAAWALEAMEFAYQNAIMKGVSATTIDPLSNTTREQGIVLIKRTYEAFKGAPNVRATLVLPTGRLITKTEQAKYLASDWHGLLNAPVYDSRLALYAATGSDKPKSKPTDKLQIASASTYSKADNGALIESAGNRVRYFAYALTRAAPSKVVWQVSRVPFVGFSQNWQNPTGLVASGQVAGTVGEFSIDFGAFASKLGSFGALQPLSLPIVRVSTTAKTQQTLYVRAVPVDGRGQCIGDPGEGIRVLYGSILSIPPSASTPNVVSATFQIWSPQRDLEPTQGKEFPNLLEHLTEVSTNAEGTSAHWFQFRNADASVTSVVVQVAAKPFSNTESWDAPAGLVYSKAYTALPISVLGNYLNAVPITFSQFGPAASTLKPGDSVPYYLRVVGLTASTRPGLTTALLSETVKVNYYKQQNVTIYQWKTVSVASYTPTIQVVHYQPVKWEDPNWAHYYTVYRYPKWNELNFNITNGSSTLYTYWHYWWQDHSMTPDRYEKEILWKWLAPGSYLQVWDKQENKSWWESLWDGIVSFFKSIVDVVVKVVNWASTSFAKLKAGIISFIASNFPLIPDSLRGYLNVALTMLVDSGLASLGIPPSLPNFDELASGGLDYLAKEGLAAAGVEADAITDAVLSQAKSVIKAKLADATNSESPNPLNAPFLHADPRYLYQPAYIDVKVANPYPDKPSLAGFLNIDTGWNWQETGITVDTTTWANLPTDQQYAAGLTYAGHFFYGLKKGYPYYPVKYCIYEPMRDIAIPSLKPGESTTVRVYLKEFTSGPYPFAPQGESVTWDDFTNLYWGATGKADFTVWTSGFNLKPITPATSLDPATNTIYTYRYDGGPMSETFQTVPKDPYK
ncbi:MAG: S-layer homology domain-containing protein [Caldiserica bacterium]|nr:S-layer homology domain-containing protein [Caldisericota bacterium]